MARTMAAPAVKALLDAQATCALIDVREAGEYNDAHIPGSSLVRRRQLEFRMPRLVPFNGTQVIVCDDDGRRATLAAATLERIGFRQVAVLAGGINRWTTEGYPTEWGVNVPSKDFGEKIQAVHHVAAKEGPRQTPGEDPRARRARTDNMADYVRGTGPTRVAGGAGGC